MVALGSNKTIQAGTLLAEEGRKLPRIRQIKKAHTSPRAAYREGFGWRFG
jgi:hypothetical protein